jgi:hypothetical protein
MATIPTFFDEHRWDDRLDAEVRSTRAASSDPIMTMLPASSLIMPRQMRTAKYQVSHHVMHGAFQNAATGFAMNVLPVILADSDGERAVAMERLGRAVVVGAGLGAGIGGLRAVIRKSNRVLKPVILDMCKGGITLQNMGKLVVSCSSSPRMHVKCCEGD